MARYESDVVIIGGGITAAMVAQKLAEQKPGISIIIVEAGKRIFDSKQRFEYRRRNLEYGENGWPGDFVPDQAARGVISRAMAVGGSALHWGGTCNRFSEEDLRLKSMYNIGDDWPLEWKELEKFYCEAERRLGVSGEPSPLSEDWRSEPYPMPAMTLSYNLVQLKGWAEQSGIPFWSTPQAKNTVDGYGGRLRCIRCNTCEICPTGARYSPDWTFKQLLADKKIQLHDQTLVRKLLLDDRTARIASAHAVSQDGSSQEHEYRAKTFAIASVTFEPGARTAWHTRRETLAWRLAGHGDDAHRHSGKTGWQSRRVDGARERGAVAGVISLRSCT
jgi:glucose dehydrogenase